MQGRKLQQLGTGTALLFVCSGEGGRHGKADCFPSTDAVWYCYRCRSSGCEGVVDSRSES
ncbi:hypothetical protein KY284_035502 [Solanum tuberosum]|nr:hypothetical protein KY284_035502 [Solanum tuberosum]